MANLTDANKILLLVAETKNNGSPTIIGGQVDTAGWNRATFLLGLGATDATVDCKIQECATPGGSYTDIAGTAITQLTATDDNSVVAIEVALPATRQRYLRPLIVVGSGATGAALALLCLLGEFQASSAELAQAALKERKTA